MDFDKTEKKEKFLVFCPIECIISNWIWIEWIQIKLTEKQSSVQLNWECIDQNSIELDLNCLLEKLFWLIPILNSNQDDADYSDKVRRGVGLAGS